MPEAPKPTRSRFASLHPTLYLWFHATVGLLLAAACAWAFYSIAEDLPEKGFLIRTDLAVTAWLQSHGTEFGESVFWTVSLLGAPVLVALLVVTAIVFVRRRDWRHLVVLAVTCGGGALLNWTLKSIFHRTRPQFASEFAARSWSFPSGHAMDSLIAYGLLAYWLQRRFPQRRGLILAGAAALIFVIGYARIYLGVHYLSDVVAGYSAGGVWLAVCITGYRFAERRRIGTGGADEA